MGVRYLWIDSLCIIQDSTEDWQHESKLMGDVYSNSWCNIAATKARDATDGYFAQRTLLDVGQCSVETKWDSHPRRRYICWVLNIWTNNVDNKPLMLRLCVLQETVLSKRVLHFSNHQMFWECSHLRACETFPSGIPDNISNPRTKVSLDPYSLRNDPIQYSRRSFKMTDLSES